jgi:hypothetical protein
VCGVEDGAEKANDPPSGRVVSTRGDVAGVLPDEYYEGAKVGSHRVHSAINLPARSTRAVTCIIIVAMNVGDPLALALIASGVDRGCVGQTGAMTASTAGWTFARSSEIDWQDLGPGVAMKTLAGADGRAIAMFRFEPGYTGAVHEHADAEFSYILEGELISTGVTMTPGDAYAAETGTTHDEFRTDTGCTLVSVFQTPTG